MNKEGGNVITEMPSRIWQFIKGGRGNKFDKTGREILRRYHENIIESITIYRKPIVKAIQILGNLISLGRLKKKQKQLHLDDLFHVFMIIKLKIGVELKLEKTHIAVLSEHLETSDQYSHLNIYKKGIMLSKFIYNTVEQMGDRYWQYDLKSNNCQVFLLAHLKSNNILNSELVKFIKQDAETLVKTLPFHGEVLKKILDLVTRGDVLIHGGNVKRINPWLEHFKKVHKNNKNLTFSEVAKLASKTYKK